MRWQNSQLVSDGRNFLSAAAENDLISCRIIKKKASPNYSSDFEYQNEPSVLRNEPPVLSIQKKLFNFIFF